MKIKKAEDGKIQYFGACVEIILDNGKTTRVRYDKKGDSILFPLPNNSNFLALNEKTWKVERLFLR